MRTISILITFLAMSVLTSWGGGLDQRADSAYMADQFAEAAGLYEQAAREEDDAHYVVNALMVHRQAGIALGGEHRRHVGQG